MGESLDTYLQNLKRLSVDCNFTAVTSLVHKEEAVRDAFIAGISSNEIRQRLLEDHNLSLQNAFDKARSLEIAQKNAQAYFTNSTQLINSSKSIASINSEDVSFDEHVAAVIEKCVYCGNKKHQRNLCPARDVVCFKCSKKGHFSKVCRSRDKRNSKGTKTPFASTASIMGLKSGVRERLHSKVNLQVSINGIEANVY